ncbi:serine hydrolase domain-containing protein [Trinickia fusca]|uniref:Class C beta-lactamase-related serine hydrolase n=1 Tax=Trinickia fusca TaxID=2419777 RepID=A0A494XY90_9BURK|nr:serine hydrolase [Trinickia fusca]RKP52553.1 class C beta-lactamase-related serine hydrolase [Trinickia fusca]
MRNRRLFLFIGTALAFLFIYIAQHLYQTVLRLPNPIVLLDLEFGWTPTSQSFKFFGDKLIEKSKNPVDFSVKDEKFDDSVIWNGKASNFDYFLKETNTRAFLIVQDGRIAYETYSNGYNRASKFASYSVAKSFVATLIGAALSEGKIRSLDDPIGDYLALNDVPAQYRNVTVGQLLSMRSGIDVDERYDSALSPVVQMYLTTDLNYFISNVSGFRYPAGQRFEYRSIDTLILAKVLTRATGVSLAEYIKQKIWNPLGASDDATWSVDSREHDVEKAFCCLNATARDFAKIGTLYLAQGMVSGNRIVSKSWTLVPATRPNRSATIVYSDGWWLPPGNVRDGDFSAIGIYGQYVYVNPLTQTIIVKLSEYGVEQDEIATLLTLRHIAHSVSGVR